MFKLRLGADEQLIFSSDVVKGAEGEQGEEKIKRNGGLRLSANNEIREAFHW